MQYMEKVTKHRMTDLLLNIVTAMLNCPTNQMEKNQLTAHDL